MQSSINTRYTHIQPVRNVCSFLYIIYLKFRHYIYSNKKKCLILKCELKSNLRIYETYRGNGNYENDLKQISFFFVGIVIFRG